jgi:hypothetical protein
MREYKILVVEEDEIRDGHLKGGGDRPMWLANHIVVRKKDGTCETIKDRWEYPGNTSVVKICLPQELTND